MALNRINTSLFSVFFSYSAKFFYPGRNNRHFGEYRGITSRRIMKIFYFGMYKESRRKQISMVSRTQEVVNDRDRWDNFMYSTKR